MISFPQPRSRSRSRSRSRRQSAHVFAVAIVFLLGPPAEGRPASRPKPGRKETSPTPSQPRAIEPDDLLRLSIVRSGAGFLVADGRSRIRMEAFIALDERRRDAYVARAALRASLGEISDVEISHPRRLAFSYAPPARTQGTDETLDVRLDLSDGGRVVRNIGFHLDPPESPLLTMHAQTEPGSDGRVRHGSISVRARASEIAVLELAVSHGRLVTVVERTHEVIRAEAEVDLSAAMNEDPRPLLAIATAVSPRGFSAESADLTRAFAARLASGPLTQFGPQFRLADGGVERLTCFVVPIPGQALADGGSGPTIVVALSTGSLGGPLVWPRLVVEGAKIANEIPIHDGLRAVAIDRPRTPGQMRILLDRTECGHVALSAPHADRPIVVEVAYPVGRRSTSSVELESRPVSK